MKRGLVILMFLFVCATAAHSQSLGSTYRTALGVKFYPGAISIKHFTKSNVALEGLGYFWRYGFRFTGLYEYHGNISGAAGLKWYVGPGAHVGFYNNKWDRQNDGELSVGIDGVLGLDYKINGAPINLSLDIQPVFNIVGDTYFDVWGGLGVRFTF
jgi:hypothetical protein